MVENKHESAHFSIFLYFLFFYYEKYIFINVFYLSFENVRCAMYLQKWFYIDVILTL